MEVAFVGHILYVIEDVSFKKNYNNLIIIFYYNS